MISLFIIRCDISGGRTEKFQRMLIHVVLFTGQGGNPPRPAEVDLRRQAAGGWQDSVRLQHPEGVHPPPRPQTEVGGFFFD